MTQRRAYCDWNATAPIRETVVAAMVRAHHLGNPSSVHVEGRAARAAVEQARAEVAALVGGGDAQVVFTSGGTEAAATALQPLTGEDMLFCGAAEHACVRAGGRFGSSPRVDVAVGPNGLVSFEALAAAIAARGLLPGHVHVAVQIANNETGAITPPELFARCAAQGWRVVADAVQAAGRIALQPYAAHVDALLLSAHKLGGPKGVGALVLRKSACGPVQPLLAGGGQERGYRAGTENVAGIVGFAAACRDARAELADLSHVRALRDRFEREVLARHADAVIFAAGHERLANTCLFAIPGLAASTALIAFDLDGVAVSSGSACSSGKVGKSHVLKAMGVADALAAGAIRVSFGISSSDEDVSQCLNSLDRQMARLRQRPSTAA